METQQTKTYGGTRSSSNRGFYDNKHLHYKIRKISKNMILHFREPEKKEHQQKQGINKDQSKNT